MIDYQMSQYDSMSQRPTPRFIIQHAMKSGVQVGAFFILQALGLLLYQYGLLSTLLYLGGLVMVPVMMIFTAVHYRDQQMGGAITYLYAVGYMLWTYLFALIIATLAYFIVSIILFASPQFLTVMEETMELFKQLSTDAEMVEALESSMYSLSPKSITMSFVTGALFFGLIFVYISALFIRKKRNV